MAKKQEETAKVNLFIKGMQSDMDEVVQPKESYRYAKNIRVTGNDSVTPSSTNPFVNKKETDGANSYSLQPYPSDRIALNLSQWVTYCNTQSLTFMGVWGDGDQYEPEEQALLYLNSNISSYIEATITITMDVLNVGEIVQEVVIDQQTLENTWNGSTDTNALIAEIINNNPEHSIQCWIKHYNPQDYDGILDDNGEPTGLVAAQDLGTWQDWVNFYFANQNNPENYVTDINVVIEGIIYGPDNANWVWTSDEIEAGAINGQFEYEQILIDKPTITSLPQLNVEVLGQYSFSDYMILLGRFGTINPTILAEMGATEAEIEAGTWPEELPGPDVVIKVKQDTDGQLYSVNDLGQIVVNDNFSFYFQGRLGFSEKQKLKVVGSEENEISRRIYFTDTTFPLRTINVSKPPSFYASFSESASFFDLFSEAQFSPVEITGFSDGGNLENRSYSYGYQYISGDGRVSAISSFSNPCAVPQTSKFAPIYQVSGGPSSKKSNKIINGRMDNLDGRFDKVKMIAVEYTSGNVTGGTYFGEFNIENGSCEWSHTGYESPMEEAGDVLAKIVIETKPWDLCKTLEIKDNRLFVGNITESFIGPVSDFSVYSYNSFNQPHPIPSQNPDICNPLLYDDISSVQPENEKMANLYRYIKGPGGEDGNMGDAFFDGNIDVNFGYSHLNDESIKKGIYGAQSENFSTPLINGECEGIRVTFRILDKCPEHMSNHGFVNETMAVSFDTKGLPKEVSYNDVRAPGVGGIESDSYIKNYSNPIFNSHFLGYRRGEIYRFGVVFFDKKGVPMFVNRIGDIRMPNHSSAYYVPTYSGEHLSNNGTGIDGFIQPWPFYYQTSRLKEDKGYNWRLNEEGVTLDDVFPLGTFVAPNNGDATEMDTDNYPHYSYYDGQSNQGGSIDKLQGFPIYPHFEVKLTTQTRNSIGGYAIVRVKREEEFKTILTSGALSRCEFYREGDGGGGTQGVSQLNWGEGDEYMETFEEAMGCQSQPLWTMRYQRHQIDIDSQPNYNRYGVDSTAETKWGYYMIDSPDIILNDYSFNNIQNTHRMEIVEGAFCMKGTSMQGGGLTLDDSGVAGLNYNPFDIADETGANFASIVKPSRLQGDSYEDTDGNNVEATSWEGTWSTGNNDPEYGDYDDMSWNDYENLFSNIVDNPEEVVSILENLSDGTDVGLNDFRPPSNYGIATKYYSKRHPIYPQKLLCKNQNNEHWVELVNDGWWGAPDYISSDNVGHTIMYPESAIDGDGFQLRPYNIVDQIYMEEVYNLDNWYNDNLDWLPEDLGDYDTGWGILFAPFFRQTKILGPGDTWSGIQNDWDILRNQLVQWPINIVKEIRNDRPVGPLNNDVDNDGANPAFYRGAETAELGAKTIAIETAFTGLTPYVRGYADSSSENCYKGVGNHNNWGNGGGAFSPETSIANIVKRTDPQTLYGGRTLKQYARNNWVYTGHYRNVEDGTGPVINTGKTWNDKYSSYEGNDGVNSNRTGHADSIFGGDTYVCYFHHRKNQHDPDGGGGTENANCHLMAYSIPIEASFNIDLRSEEFWLNYSHNVPAQIQDDTAINSSYFAHNKAKTPQGQTDEEEFKQILHFPSEVRWSELKQSGDTIDNYGVFPPFNKKDLDYTKGPITQMFKVRDKLYSLQHSGAALLNVNPKAILNTEAGNALVAFAGSDAVLEDIDYISENYGSQHFFGKAITENNAYYFDSNNSKLLRLGPKGGDKRDAATVSIESLGESKSMQNFFQSFKNKKINDKPLFHGSLIVGSGNGGISMGYDPEYGEVLVTIKPEEDYAKTIVYNEFLGQFTSFLSKRASFYFNHKGRLYSIYDNIESLDEEFEAVDVEEGVTAGSMPFFKHTAKTRQKFKETLQSVSAPHPETSEKTRHHLELRTKKRRTSSDIVVGSYRMPESEDIDSDPIALANPYDPQDPDPDPVDIIGCMDDTAINYDADATIPCADCCIYDPSPPDDPGPNPDLNDFDGDSNGDDADIDGDGIADGDVPSEEAVEDEEIWGQLELFESRGLEKIWLSNGFKFLDIDPSDNPDEQLYLKYGGINYYYTEPLEVELILNDSPTQSKIFDSISLGMQVENNDQPNIFTKFVFRGDSEDFEHMQALDNDFLTNEGIEGGVPSSNSSWYKIKDGIHFVPVRQDGVSKRVRGRYASVRMIMQIGTGDFGEFLTPINMSYNFNLFSVLSKHRISRI